MNKLISDCFDSILEDLDMENLSELVKEREEFTYLLNFEDMSEFTKLNIRNNLKQIEIEAIKNDLSLTDAFIKWKNHKELLITKLNQVYELLGECSKIADERGIPFDFNFDGLRDTYIPNRGWSNSYC